MFVVDELEFAVDDLWTVARQNYRGELFLANSARIRVKSVNVRRVCEDFARIHVSSCEFVANSSSPGIVPVEL